MAFSFYRTVTIDHMKCGGSDSADFPMLINTTNAAAGVLASFKWVTNGGQVQSQLGYDIRPYADSALSSALTFELVDYDPTTGVFEMWVKLSTLAHATDTVIYLAYGDASISTDGSSAATWSNGFQAVWHFRNSSSLNSKDSSNNGNDLITNQNSVGTVAGQATVGCAVFAASSFQLLQTPTNPLSGAAQGTLSGWFYRAASSDTVDIGASNNSGGANNNEYAVSWAGSDHFYCVVRKGAPDTNFAFSTVLDGQTGWHHFACMMDGSTQTYKFYIDGVLDSSPTVIGTPPTSFPSTSIPFYNVGWDNGVYSTGKIDETRLANALRSADWVLSEYNNQNLPDKNAGVGGFYTVGSETTTSGNLMAFIGEPQTGSSPIQGGLR